MPQTIPCNCGEPVEVPDPRLELVNQYTVSMIVWAHGEPISCAACGALIIGMIPELPVDAIKLRFMPLPKDASHIPVAKPQPKSRIINPFGD